MTHPQHLAAVDAAEPKEIRTACPHLDAVTAGLSTPGSSGQVEGHVTRVNSSNAWPMGERIPVSCTNEHSWPHAPATGASRCEIA